MLKLHHWEYDLALAVHRCEESHPFLHPEGENPCNGCGAIVTDEALSRHLHRKFPRLAMDLIESGDFGERSRG